MKKMILFFALTIFAVGGFAQSEVLVQSNEKGLYVPHTVAAKENFYSIGRTYAISPKEIAAFNNLDMANGLSIGQTINVPLTAANFSQSAEGGTPVYYVVGEKEGLYRVSVKNNKVLMANLRKWNKLSNDAVSTGQKLIVGYIQATGVPPTTVAQTNTAPPPADNVVTQSAPKEEAPKKDPPPAAKPVVTTPQRQLTATGTGYFKPQFDAQSRSNSAGKEQTVSGSIFKTSSGWQDGKYYALMDGVEPGTIIKVENPGNSKVVFAKVLGQMSGIRQNQGLDVRISNAAATALDIAEQDKFVVKVVY